MNPKEGVVIWVTGPPASGKSTLAGRIRERLERPSVLLDGDPVRAALAPALGYGAADRDAFYTALARLAALLARQGLVVVVAATAPWRAHRRLARALAPRFIEVFVDVPPEECARRDEKGLYALAQAGGAPELPGVGVEYERPRKAEVTAGGGLDENAAEQTVALIR